MSFHVDTPEERQAFYEDALQRQINQIAQSEMPLEDVDGEILEQVAKLRIEMQKTRMRQYKEIRDAEQSIELEEEQKQNFEGEQKQERVRRMQEEADQEPKAYGAQILGEDEFGQQQFAQPHRRVQNGD